MLIVWRILSFCCFNYEFLNILSVHTLSVLRYFCPGEGDLISTTFYIENIWASTKSTMNQMYIYFPYSKINMWHVIVIFSVVFLIIKIGGFIAGFSMLNYALKFRIKFPVWNFLIVSVISNYIHGNIKINHTKLPQFIILQLRL